MGSPLGVVARGGESERGGTPHNLGERPQIIAPILAPFLEKWCSQMALTKTASKQVSQKVPKISIGAHLGAYSGDLGSPQNTPKVASGRYRKPSSMETRKCEILLVITILEACRPAPKRPQIVQKLFKNGVSKNTLAKSTTKLTSKGPSASKV